MKVVKYPKRKDWGELLLRPVQDFKAIKKIVNPIIKKVRKKGDKAMKKFALEYDHVELDKLLVSHEEIANAEKEIGEDLKTAIAMARDNIIKFHSAQFVKELVVETMPGVVCRRKLVPIQRVGLYIPGGTAPLFSTVLMLGVPAQLAGCGEIVLVTPCDHQGNISPAVLYTANLIGIKKIVKAGGAQAIAALAYGTETIPKVDKIFGPGNQFVTTAKQIISQYGVAIDMPAGPSEVAIIADNTAIPEFVASDLLSQAEHGPDSQVLLVTTDAKLIDAVKNEIDKRLERLPRKDHAKRSLENSRAILMKTLAEAMEFINEYAPEHLIIMTEDADELAEQVVNAGSVFVGNYSPESAGDYASGTNHVLPTNGYAKAFSGVSIDSFVKKITYQKLTPEGIKALGPGIELMAEAEQLLAHKDAISVRLNYLQNLKNG
jgi:histidinol dehydrogenase